MERYGSRRQYERMAERGPPNDEFGSDEIEFIGERDSFYMASQEENGWPYLQHRGGPKGFLKVLNSRTLAFADCPQSDRPADGLSKVQAVASRTQYTGAAGQWLPCLPSRERHPHEQFRSFAEIAPAETRPR